MAGEMEKAHPEQVRERGWSEWEALALGIDNTILARFGQSLLDDPTVGPEAKKAGAALVRHSTFEDEWDDNNDDSKFTDSDFTSYFKLCEEVNEEVRDAYLWLSTHYEEVEHCVDGAGFNALKSVGESMKAFGAYELHSYPGRDIYEGDEVGYNRWREDAKAVGAALLGEESTFTKTQAFLWLRDWHDSLWD